jgi:hypothetical protein
VGTSASPDDPPPRGRIARAGAAVVGFFEGVGKIAAGIAAVLTIAATVGLVTLTGGGADEPHKARASATAAVTPREARVDRAEIQVSASVPSLPRENDASGANDYVPDNVLDGDRRTAWVEGVPGLGLGARLTFRFPQRVRLTGVRIVNGYAKSTAALLDNAAPRTLLISTDGRSAPVRARLPHDSRPQTTRADFGPTRRVVLEVESAYRGDRFQDLAISEVSFLALPA